MTPDDNKIKVIINMPFSKSVINLYCFLCNNILATKIIILYDEKKECMW